MPMPRKTSSDKILSSEKPETSLNQSIEAPSTDTAPAVKPPAPKRKVSRKTSEQVDKKTPASVRVLDEELIRRRAYEIWEERGRPEGASHEDWLRAEAELRN